MTDLPGKKLRSLKLDTGAGEAAAITVVTNAANVNVGARVCVAQVGAKVRTESGELQVKRANVGGVLSEGMLLDAPALGWTGGGAGAAALVPDSFALGSRPPEKRPRLDGK
jgi:tRNA-binding EMAP/Myf-like protein